MAARPRRRDRRHRVDRRGGQPVVHALRRLRPRGPDRRAHRFRAERRLARRLPQRRRGRRGAAADRRGGFAARHGAPRQLGGRGGGAVRAQPLRLQRSRRLDGRPGRAPRSSRTATGFRSRMRSQLTASISTPRSRLGRSSTRAAAYLELHIEQGPVLEGLGLPLGVVLGTFGVERHRITWRGQAAHAGSTPMDKRRDALAGRGEARARDPRDREANRRGCRLHLGRGRLRARHRDLGRRDRRAASRPARPDAAAARSDARRGEGSERAVRRRGVDRRRVGADLVDRADPLRRDADRLLRGGDPRGGRARCTGSPPARCTTQPRCRVRVCRR